MSEKLRAVIVGTGYIAGRHAGALSERDDVEIVAHVDVTRETADAAAEKWGGIGYVDLAAALSEQKADAAWICVPPFAHGAIERTCLEHGVAMYIEKPIDSSVEIATVLADEIRQAGAVVAVGYYWRCLPVVETLQAQLEAHPLRMVRMAWHGPTPPAAWWQRESKSGGQIVEQVTHLVDFVRYIVGEPTHLMAAGLTQPRDEFPDLDVTTSSVGVMLFDGVVGVLSATCVLDKTLDAYVEFYCDYVKVTLGRENLVVENANGREIIPITDDALVLADDQFVTAVRQRDRDAVHCTYDDALETQRVCVKLQAQINGSASQDVVAR